MATMSQPDIGAAKPTLHARTKRDANAAHTKADGADAKPVGGEPVVTRTALTVRPFDAEQRDKMVAEAAYYRAQRRDFAPGHEVEDWLASEAEVDEHLYRLYGEGRAY